MRQRVFGTGALDRLYQTGDGWVCLAVRSDAEFSALVEALGAPELAADERFASAPARTENDDELHGLLEARFTEKTAAEWESMLSAARVGYVEVNMTGQPVFTVYDPVLRETQA